MDAINELLNKICGMKEVPEHICKICEGKHKLSSDKLLVILKRFWNRVKPPEPKPEPPSLAEKAFNFGKALVNHALAGFPKSDDSEYNRRMLICKSCEFFRKNGTCGQCGCNMTIKAAWEESRCPLRKWELPLVDVASPVNEPGGD